MKSLTVYVLALYPDTNYLRKNRSWQEKSLFDWLDETGIELREVEWDGRIDALFDAQNRGDIFCVRASNYMKTSYSSSMGESRAGRPIPDALENVVRFCQVANIPVFYNGCLLHQGHHLPINDNEDPGLIPALTRVLVED